MTTEEFKIKCEEWLNPIGYTLINGTLRQNYFAYNFSNNETDNCPIIKCFHSDDTSKVILIKEIPRLFLTIQSPELPFGQPDIEKFINSIRHYSIICHNNPAF